MNTLGTKEAAYFFMPIQMAAFLNIIASSISQAFVSEASQKEDSEMHRQQLKATIFHMFKILIPAALMLSIFGWAVLYMYGRDYADHGYVPLVVLSITGVLIGLNWIADTWMIVSKRMNVYVVMNIVKTALIVGFVYTFSQNGLVAASIGWLIAQLIHVLLYYSTVMRRIIFDRRPAT